MSEIEYIDITDRFRSACSQLTYGQIVALPEFSYLESMSAVELLDARLDSGMALLNEKKVEVSAELSPAQLQAYIDTTLIHIAQWLEGQSLPHTLYSSIFLHDSSLTDKNFVVKAVTVTGIYLSDALHKLIQQTNCLREDDYAYAAIAFDNIDPSDTENSLLKAEKIAETEETLIRLKFLRGLYCIIHNITKIDGLTSAENYLAFAIKQFSLIKPIENEDVSVYFNKNLCLNKLPHFLPNKIYDAKNYDFARAQNRINSFLKSIEYLIKLREVSEIDDLLESLNEIPSFDIFSRTIYESVIFTQSSSQIMLFSKTPLTELILKSMQKFGVDTEFLKLSEEFGYFLSRVEIVFKEYIILKLKNKTRQQRILAKYLSDFNILVNEAHFLTEKLYSKVSQKPEKQLLFQWVFHKTTKAMIEYIRYSFELQLYNDKDIGMVMFYLDFLYGVIFSNLNSQAQYLNSKHNKKKKKKFDLKTNEIDCKYSLGLQYLCRGIVRFYLLVGSISGLKAPDLAEATRFQKRFRAFKAVQMPQMLEYSSYESIKAIPNDINYEQFANACKESLDSARNTLREVEAAKPVKSLLRVCVKNLLALTLVKKLEWKCKASYEYIEDKVFPVFLINPL